ncbi:MAG TPA: gamma-glutamyltransferase [Stellaceae bacterium]|nr:gamma-glutamyltransferase [Stellaceae bacterium]
MGHRAAIRAADRERTAEKPVTRFALAFLLLAITAHTAAAETRRDMVESADPRAAAIGRDILRAGGGAADAAAAMAIALTSLEPQSAGIGGGGFLVYYAAHAKKVSALDGRESAPAAAKPDRFLDKDGKPLPFPGAMLDARSIGVPGLLRLAEEMHRRWGKLPWAAIVAPSQKIAADGFALSPRVAKLLAEDTHLPQNPVARALWYEADGSAKPAGATIVNPALAASLHMIADKGAGAFYEGPIARDIVSAVANANPPGDLTAEDLRAYRVKERPVLCAPYRDTRVCGMGLPAGTSVVLEILGLLEPFDLKTHTADAEAWHLFAAASRLAYADRIRFLGDPDFVKSPVAGLLDTAYLAARAKLIEPAHFEPGRVPPGEPAGQRSELWGDERPPEFPATSNISVVDSDGNAAAMTVTIDSDFGSHVLADGFLLDNELDDFSFVPEDDGRPVANRVEPGKRPLSAMSPTIVFDRSGALRLVVGSAGGPPIITDVAKAIVAVVDWRMSLKDALALPNIDDRDIGPTELESSAPPALAERLRAMGHTLRLWGRDSGLGGILVTKDGLEGATDPRREGAALGD